MHPVLFTPEYLGECYSCDYLEAKNKFSLQVQEHPALSLYREFDYAEKGPEGEALVTSVVWLGDAAAEHVLVVQSATHGVEGFAGSAIQLDTLKRLTVQSLPKGVAILFVHVINPHGFAWLRRVNEQGVDLNRNFVDFNQPLPANEGYTQLANYILPAALSDWESATKKLAAYRDEFGQCDFEKAISSGQYEYADGLFYGGAAPSQSRINLEKIIDDYELLRRRSVAVIDIHTGLGPFSYGEVICDHPPGSPGVQLARAWYGESVTEPALGSSTSVVKHGLIDYLWHQRLGEKVCFVTLEFGTYPVEQMFEVLRRDHFMHRNIVDWGASETRQVKQAIRKFFYPETADWQEMVLMRGRQCIDQALQGLSEQ